MSKYRTLKTRHLLGICLAGLLVMSATDLPVVQAQENREITRTIAFNEDGRVSIKAYKGTIVVKTWNQPQIDIKARIEADGLSRREEEAVALTEVRIDEGPDRVYIASDYEQVNDLRNGWGWDGGFSMPFVHYTITLPATARLEIEDHKSEIDISGMKAPLRVNTHKGDTVIKDVTGDLRIDTHKARVRITGLSGSLDLNTHKSDVEVEFAQLSERSRIETYKGEINITLPETAGFDLDADMGRKGDLRSDFDLKSIERRFGRRDRDLEYRGAVNGGGPLLNLRTDKGYYRLRRR